MLRVPGIGDRNTQPRASRHSFGTKLSQRLEYCEPNDDRIKHGYADPRFLPLNLQDPCTASFFERCCGDKWQWWLRTHVALVQSRVRRALVLPWRRRRDIAQCLGHFDESSDVVDALISDPWLTDHVYVEGELDERRLVDLAGIVRERGRRHSRAKDAADLCVVRAAPCGCLRKHFRSATRGRPHYCSVACQRNHWEAGHTKQLREGQEMAREPRSPNPSLLFSIDGHVVDLYEIGKRGSRRRRGRRIGARRRRFVSAITHIKTTPTPPPRKQYVTPRARSLARSGGRDPTPCSPRRRPFGRRRRTSPALLRN